MRLVVVGCTGSVPGPDSPASCYLLEAPGEDGRTWRILLDLGSGALGALQRHADPSSLDAVVLSHLHPDHCLDACGLHVWLRYGPSPRQGPPVRLLGPSRTAERLDAAYRAGPGEPGLPESYDVQALTAGEPVRIGPFEVTPFPARHTTEAYALRVEAGGRVLAYSGDTDSCDGLLAAAAGADVLLAEAGFPESEPARGVHLTPRRAGEAAAAAGARRLLLTHLPPWADRAVAAEEARAACAAPVEVVAPDAVHEV